MGIEEDTLRELKSLNQNIGNFVRSAGRMAGSARNDGARDDYDPDKRGRRGSKLADSQTKAADSYNSAAKKFLKVSGNLTKDIADSNDDFRLLRSSFKEGAEAMFDLKERVDKWGDGTAAMTSQAVKIAAGLSRFQSTIAKTSKAQSLLYAEQLKQIDGFKDFEKAAYFDELSKALGALSDSAKRRLKLIDEDTGQLKSDLSLQDFQKVRTTLGEMEASIKEVLGGTDFKSLSDLAQAGKNAFVEKIGTEAVTGNDKSSANKEAITKVAALLQARGMYNPTTANTSVLDSAGNVKGAAALNSIDWEQLAANVAHFEMSFEKTNQALDRNVDVFNSKWARLIKSVSNSQGQVVALDTVKKMAADFLSSGAAFHMAKDKIVKAYEEISSFNIAGIPASYNEVMSASVKLGLSFTDTVKLMDENKRLLAIYGPQKFETAFGNLSKTFEKYGYTMQQAAEMVGPTVDSAISAGINIRDPGQLNTFTDNMLGQFQKISGIVKISAAEFATLNKTLFQSEGTFDTMLGLNQQQRQAYADSLVQQRTLYVAKGLEVQQAQALVEAQQQQQRGRLAERTSDAAKLMALAQISGRGDLAGEAFNLTSKGRRTKEEQDRLTQIAGLIHEANESSINAGYAESEAAGNMQNEAALDLTPGGQVGTIIKAGSQMQVTGEAGGQVSTGEVNAAAGRAQGSAAVASLGNSVNQLSALLNNSLLASIGASSLALFSFAFQLTKTASLLGGLGGGGGGMLGDLLGGFGKAGGIGGKLLKSGGIGLIGAAADIGLGYAGDALKSGAAQGSARQGAGIGASILSDTAGFAGTGAAIGSIIPGVGTAIGAGVGALAGTGYGLYKNWGDVKNWWGTPAAPAIGMPTGGPGPSVGGNGSAPGAPGTTINTPAQDGSSFPNIMGVQDKDALAQLQTIATNLSMAVTYLQKLSDAAQGNQSPLAARTTNMMQLPSQYEFTTGRTGRT